jgi:hypothetical protein
MGLSIALTDLPSLSGVAMRTKISQCDVRNLLAVELPPCRQSSCRLAGSCLAADGEFGRRLKPEIFDAYSAALCRQATVCLPRQRARRRRGLRKLKHGQWRDGVLAVSDERCVQEWHMFHIRGYVTRVRSVWLGNSGRGPWV